MEDKQDSRGNEDSTNNEKKEGVVSKGGKKAREENDSAHERENQS